MLFSILFIILVLRLLLELLLSTRGLVVLVAPFMLVLVSVFELLLLAAELYIALKLKLDGVADAAVVVVGVDFSFLI